MLLGLVLAIGLSGKSQPGNPSVRHYFSVSSLPAAHKIQPQKQAISADSSFFLGADSMRVSQELQRNAQCKEGQDQWLPYGKARFHRDTLIISLFRISKDNIYHLETKVWSTEFMTQYHIIARNGLSEVRVLPTDQVLILQKSGLEPGDTVVGFVNFRGTRWEQKAGGKAWEPQRDWVESPVVIRGPFKILIE